MNQEDKAALYAILYGQFKELHAEINAIKSVLTDEQRALVESRKATQATEIHNSGALDAYLDFLKPDSKYLP